MLSYWNLSVSIHCYIPIQTRAGANPQEERGLSRSVPHLIKRPDETLTGQDIQAINSCLFQASTEGGRGISQSPRVNDIREGDQSRRVQQRHASPESVVRDLSQDAEYAHERGALVDTGSRLEPGYSRARSVFDTVER